MDQAGLLLAEGVRNTGMSQVVWRERERLTMVSVETVLCKGPLLEMEIYVSNTDKWSDINPEMYQCWYTKYQHH